MAKKVDYSGVTSGRLTVIKPTGTKSKAGVLLWLASCTCGGEKVATGPHFKQGRITSCGCILKERIASHIGEKFNMLTVDSIEGRDSSGCVTYNCTCDCGGGKVTTIHKLKTGYVKSCGCLIKHFLKKGKSGKDNPTYTHGLSKHPLYTIWSSMRQRCYLKGSVSYHNYGGRGITVCEEWDNDFKPFYDWMMSNGWVQRLEIDRIDNDGNYSPDNCRVVTRKQNCQNRRPMSEKTKRKISETKRRRQQGKCT